MPVHPFDPVFDADSRILILGSFPSVRSREEGFYYAHPRNRFWPVMAALFGAERIPVTTAEKKRLLLDNHVALWDVVASCEITASRDDTITGAAVNDIGRLLSVSNISGIFCNGQTAHRLYRKYLQEALGRTAVCLPSTSPANAAADMESLLEAWKRILG